MYRTFEQKVSLVDENLRGTPNMPDARIAEACGVLPYFVESQRKFLGIPRARHSKSDEKMRFVEPITDPDVYFAKSKRGRRSKLAGKLNEIVDLVKYGYSIPMIGMKFGVSARQVHYVLAEHGVSVRAIKGQLL